MFCPGDEKANGGSQDIGERLGRNSGLEPSEVQNSELLEDKPGWASKWVCYLKSGNILKVVSLSVLFKANQNGFP